MTNTRTDVHRPSAFVPAHYRLLDVLDLYAGSDRDDVAALVADTRVPTEWAAYGTKAAHDRANYEALAIGERPALGQCSICGHHIRYAAVWSYEPGDGMPKGIITSGLDCAEKVEAVNLTELREKVGALQEFSARMRRIVRDAEEAHREAAPPDVPADVQAFLDDHARRHADMPEDCILCSFALQASAKGRLSERQVEVARDIAAKAEAVMPATGEGIEVVGRVRSCSAEKMHALVDVGERRDGLRRVAAHRVWLPVTKPVAPGTRVRFVAKLRASDKDGTFLIASHVSGQAIL